MHADVWSWLRAYDPASLGQTLAEGGFDVDAVLGDVAGRPCDPDAHVFEAVARPTAVR